MHVFTVGPVLVLPPLSVLDDVTTDDDDIASGDVNKGADVTAR